MANDKQIQNAENGQQQKTKKPTYGARIAQLEKKNAEQDKYIAKREEQIDQLYEQIKSLQSQISYILEIKQEKDTSQAYRFQNTMMTICLVVAVHVAIAAIRYFLGV